jgi:hypothetical protein
MPGPSRIKIIHHRQTQTLKAPYLVTYDDLWDWQSTLTKAMPLQQQAMIMSGS